MKLVNEQVDIDVNEPIFIAIHRQVGWQVCRHIREMQDQVRARVSWRVTDRVYDHAHQPRGLGNETG